MSDAENKTGIFCWNELMTGDTGAAGAFYSELFGWTVEPMEGGAMPYFFFKQGDLPVAGMVAINPAMGEMPPHWVSYVSVEDIDASVASVGPLGGRVLNPVTDVGMGKLAVIQDPTGAVFSFWQAAADKCE